MPNKQPILTPSDLIIVKKEKANKLGQRAQGQLTYQLGYVTADKACYLQIIHNDSGGYFSKEWLPINTIETCLTLEMKKGAPFSTSILKPAFISQSQNNAGFLGAVLRQEGILEADKEKHASYCFKMKAYQDWCKAIQKMKPLDTGRSDTSDAVSETAINDPVSTSAPVSIPVQPKPSTTSNKKPIAKETLGLSKKSSTGKTV